MSCVTNPRKLQELPAVSQVVALSGFSISTPNEAEWYVAQRGEHSLQLAKQGKAIDETYAIQSWAMNLPEFYNDEGFVGYVTEGIRKDTDPARFIEVENKASIVKTKNGVCVSIKSIHKDISPMKRTKRPEPILLEVRGMTCRNPSSQSTGAHLVYSNRYYSDNPDPELTQKAESLFGSLEFQQ